MSYRLLDNSLIPPPSTMPARPVTYPLPRQTFPLSQVETDASALAREQGITVGKVLLALVVIAVVLLLLKKLAESSEKKLPGSTVKNPVDRATTQQLARKLYERLDARGGANPDMLRSLAMHAKPKART